MISRMIFIGSLAVVTGIAFAACNGKNGGDADADVGADTDADPDIQPDVQPEADDDTVEEDAPDIDGEGADIAAIIPENRRIDWTSTGVPGGIPGWTRVCATIDAATYGDGAADATAAIQSAVDDCETSAPDTSPGPGVVMIPEGTYRVDGRIALGTKSYIVIRGAGADRTTIVAGGETFLFGVNGLASLGIPITAGATQGSTELTLESAADLSVDQLIDVSEDNEAGLVFTNHGSTNDLKQMALVTGISGSTITITPPLIWTLSSNPVVLFGFIGLERFAGLEDMKIDHSGGGSGSSFTFDQCYGCWARGIYSYKPGGYHTFIVDSLSGEVRDCCFNDSQTYGSNNAGLNVRGSTNAGVNQGAVTAFRFENNIFDRAFPGVEMQNASSGCAIAYNYGYATQAGDYTPGDTYVGWNSGMLNDNHGPHDMMNLWEGNVAEQFISDGYFGSSSHGTLLRNHLWGRNPRFEISWNAVSLDRWAYFYNIVGNVLGLADPLPVTYQFAGTDDCGAGSGIYRLGFPNMGNCGLESYDGQSPEGLDDRVADTLLRWGNFDYVSNAVLWEAPEIPDDVPLPSTQSLPASLIYTGRPSWWPAGVAWPPIGPDVTGGQDGSGHAWKIPAELCYESSNLGEGGTFSREACYGG
jgi:hypothetical protein